MKVQNLNASSVKTKRRIREAFLELLEEKKSLRKITIRELTERADINRTTFYTHYHDIYEIAEELEAEVMRDIITEMPIQSREDITRFFEQMWECFRANEDTYRKLLSSDEPMVFLGRLRSSFKEKMKHCAALSGKPQTVFNLSIFIDGMAEQFISYFRNRSPYSFAQLTAHLRRTLQACLMDPEKEALFSLENTVSPSENPV